MQPLPPAGPSSFSDLIRPTPAAGSAAPAGPQDRLERSSPASGPLIPGHLKPALPAAPPPPRPWPSPLAERPATECWSTLASRASAPAAAGACLSPGLGGAFLPELAGLTLPGLRDPDPWEAAPTPQGWKTPRNPDRAPVGRRDPFEIVEGSEDLGPLRLVPSCAGRLRALRLHWPEEFLDPAFAAQREVLFDLLRGLPPDVTLHVVAEGRGALGLQEQLAGWPDLEPNRVRIYPLQLRSTAELLFEPMTMWARDPALLLRAPGQQRVLMLPRSFRGDNEVDPKLNRLVIQGTGAAPSLFRETAPDLLVRRSELNFEGGDVVASRRAVLLGGQSLQRSIRDLRLGREAVLQKYAALFGLPVVVVEPQPDFHIDLGFTFFDDETVAVADPGATIERVRDRSELQPLIEATLSKGVVAAYDRAAASLSSAGYRVVRLPNLCGVGLLTPYLTYNNVLMEQYAQVRRVYLPSYGVPELDEWARTVYAEHGFQIVDMPGARWSTRLWGAIRCATGELWVSDW